jgi:hypothetical protein
MLNTGLNQGSAKIYQFPVGGRAAFAGHRQGETRTELAASVNAVACCDSWYHAAAIEDEKTGRDH